MYLKWCRKAVDGVTASSLFNLQLRWSWRDLSVVEENRSDEFLSLLAEHESQVFGFLFALVCHRQDAEDLMQQTTLTMWREFDRFESGTNFTTWACTIAKNSARNYFRTQSRRKVFSEAMAELLAQAQESQDIEARMARRNALKNCLEKLSTKDRDLVSMCYESSSSITDVAQAIGRPVAGVYNSLSRIRRALFECINATLSSEGFSK